MGYLKMQKSLGDFRKGVVSFWFRVPQETVTACRAAHTVGWAFAPYLDVVPLLSWGSQQTFTQDTFGTSGPMAPSYIGVFVGPPGNPMTALMVNLQTPDLGTSSLASSILYPDSFGNNFDRLNSGFPAVLVDHWNHVILSWELQDTTVSDGTVVGSSKMWCSVNDVNKSGDEDLPALTKISQGPNDHISAPGGSAAWGVEGQSSSVNVTAIESNPFQIPGPHPLDYNTDPESVSTRPVILKVEMAELQVFAGVTLDTSVTANRRLFVDGDGVPASPGLALEHFHKRPEILLTGSSDWTSGHNLGSLGFNYNVDPPEIRPDGQFTPTGNILAFEPDPSLHGPQVLSPRIRLPRKPVAAQ